MIQLSTSEPRAPSPLMNAPAAPKPQNSETQEMSRARDSFIGPYRIELKIGDGGMGVVYKCWDARLKRFVALKVLKEKYARDPQYHQRLHREAQAIAALSHKNIAQIYSIEDGNGATPYLVMEHIEGSSAEGLVQKGPLEPTRAAAIAREAASGLRAALEKGIIHRDVKPSNILIAVDGSVKLVDFGLAKALEETRPITDEGIVLGTPQYISPEQGRGQRADLRSDIYSLGATLYHLVTGRPPFSAESQAGVILAHLNDTPAPPHRILGSVPETMSQVIGKMMAKDPARRYARYDELIDDLDHLAKGLPIAPSTVEIGAATFRRPAQKVPPRYWWMAFTAVAAAVAVTLMATLRLLPLGGPLGGEGADPLMRLGRWHLRQEDGTECLALSFGSIPEGMSRPEALHSLFLLGRADGDSLGLEPQGVLRLRASTAPAALRFPWERIDELRIQGLQLDPSSDFALAIVHPRGARLRSLVFAIASADPASRRGGGEAPPPCRDPIRAERNSTPVPLEPAPPAAPCVAAGPHDLEIRLRPEGGKTRLELSLRRSAGPGDPVYSTPTGGILVEGTDWNRGTIGLWAASPLGRGGAALAELVAVGAIDRREALSSLPWETAARPERPVLKVEHGPADRR